MKETEYITEVEKIVSTFFGVEPDTLHTSTHKAVSLIPRQIVIYFCRRIRLNRLDAGYSRKGYCASKDVNFIKLHILSTYFDIKVSTVLHSENVVDNYVGRNQDFFIKPHYNKLYNYREVVLAIGKKIEKAKLIRRQKPAKWNPSVDMAVAPVPCHGA